MNLYRIDTVFEPYDTNEVDCYVVDDTPEPGLRCWCEGECFCDDEFEPRPGGGG